MGTVHHNMSHTADNPGVRTLCSALLPSVMLLASGRFVGKKPEHNPGDDGNYRVQKLVSGDLRTKSSDDREPRAGFCRNSAEENELLIQASPCILTTSASLASSLQLFPSPIENRKFDYNESCYLQTSALSKLFSDTIQIFQI